MGLSLALLQELFVYASPDALAEAASNFSVADENAIFLSAPEFDSATAERLAAI